MRTLPDNIAALSTKQRTLLEVQLKRKRDHNSELGTLSNNDSDPSSPRRGDDENLVLAESKEAVDKLLGKFYGRFPWPWKPMKFDYLSDPYFEIAMLNQDVGDWGHQRIPKQPRIWVAGCGTNQALHTALRFPQASVLGSDLSAESLEICCNNANELGISNLELKQESINQIAYKEEFDYVISTGVIHHNADPKATLEKIAGALKPTGILELMVYNRYHRIVTSAFQKAIRIFRENDSSVDFESELSLAKKIVDNLPVKEVLAKAFTQYMDWSESDFADLLIQPVEHSYTVESLEDLVSSCDLEYVLPCISKYAKSLSAVINWNLRFNDEELQDSYDSIPDSRRWQVTNLFLHEKSSLLWFYLQRKDAARPRKTEAQVCEEFLDTKFEIKSTSQYSYILGNDEHYVLSPKTVPYPLASPDASVRDIVDLVDKEYSMRDIFRQLGISTRFSSVNQARIKLATSAFPYLQRFSNG